MVWNGGKNLRIKPFGGVANEHHSMLTIASPAKVEAYRETKHFRRNTKRNVLWLQYSGLTSSLDIVHKHWWSCYICFIYIYIYLFSAASPEAAEDLQGVGLFWWLRRLTILDTAPFKKVYIVSSKLFGDFTFLHRAEVIALFKLLNPRTFLVPFK